MAVREHETPGGAGTARTFHGLDEGDLRRLAILAQMDLEQFFAEHPRWRRAYGDRLIGIVLAEQAAAHYVHGQGGIKDFSVWSLFREHPDGPYPSRRKRVVPFGDPRFGRCLERPAFEGRPVDLVGRSIPAALYDDPAQVIRRFLETDPGAGAQRMRRHPVVMLVPVERLGEVVWPGEGDGVSTRTGTLDDVRGQRWRKP